MATKKVKKHFVAQELEESANTFQQRNELYGNTYKQHGNVMAALFPNGIQLETTHDMNRMGVLNMMVSKLTRYANNWSEGGHYDSLHDLAVYSTMLNDLDINGEG